MFSPNNVGLQLHSLELILKSINKVRRFKDVLSSKVWASWELNVVLIDVAYISPPLLGSDLSFCVPTEG